MFKTYLDRWALTGDGDAFETPSSWLLPVRTADAAAMLKVFKPDSDERGGVAVLRYFGGNGAVCFIESDGGAYRVLTPAGADSWAQSDHALPAPPSRRVWRLWRDSDGGPF